MFFKSTILTALAVTAIRAQQQQPTLTTCYTCASVELGQWWELTGLIQPSGMKFTQMCDEINALPFIGQAEQCNGPCLTMILQNPDLLSDGASVENLSSMFNYYFGFTIYNVGNKFIVRGCHPKLTGTVAKVDLSRGTYCEYDRAFRRPDSFGNFRETKVLIEFCVGMGCNSRWQYPAPDDYNGPQCIGSNQYGQYGGSSSNNYNNNYNNSYGYASIQCRIIASGPTA